MKTKSPDKNIFNSAGNCLSSRCIFNTKSSQDANWSNSLKLTGLHIWLTVFSHCSSDIWHFQEGQYRTRKSQTGPGIRRSPSEELGTWSNDTDVLQ